MTDSIVTGQAPILVAGATGYVGGRLVATLAAAGHHVRAMARRPAAVDRGDTGRVSAVPGDVLDLPSLLAALQGVHTAYYLVHAMGSKRGFAPEEARGACNFACAAGSAGVRRIIYLGALGASEDSPSAHLRSRARVGEILCKADGVEVITFRASVIIGAGSLSFELVRHLTERLPVMITPRWVETPATPIHIDDMLAYLTAALEQAPGPSRVYDVGSREQVSYGDLIRFYAEARGLVRHLIRVPVLTPRLSAWWLSLVTPVYARVGRKLVEGMKAATVVEDDSARRDFPLLQPRSPRDAIAQVLRDEDAHTATTHWADAVSSTVAQHDLAGDRLGNHRVDHRMRQVAAPAHLAFEPIRRIGGGSGWYWGNWLWVLRGWLDLLVGGVGMRRGRRDPHDLRVGAVVDCWRVADYRPGVRLLLEAEMRLPGRAWLEFEVHPDPQDPGACRIEQTAVFDPLGLPGLLYWYGVYPLHALVFRGMLRGIARRAEDLAADPPPPPSSPPPRSQALFASDAAVLPPPDPPASPDAAPVSPRVTSPSQRPHDA